MLHQKCLEGTINDFDHYDEYEATIYYLKDIVRSLNTDQNPETGEVKRYFEILE
jgi:hypothetical protein